MTTLVNTIQQASECLPQAPFSLASLDAVFAAHEVDSFSPFRDMPRGEKRYTLLSTLPQEEVKPGLFLEGGFFHSPTVMVLEEVREDSTLSILSLEYASVASRYEGFESYSLVETRGDLALVRSLRPWGDNYIVKYLTQD